VGRATPHDEAEVERADVEVARRTDGPGAAVPREIAHLQGSPASCRALVACTELGNFRKLPETSVPMINLGTLYTAGYSRVPQGPNSKTSEASGNFRGNDSKPSLRHGPA
jgi:hypothetical protein